ncbi:MAG: hypothetical protein RIT81_22720 [Deltaproteobacteria bacterium]
MRRFLWLLLFVGCTGSDGPSLDQVDCSACSADQVCWYDYDLDADAYRGHCAAWPSYCDADRSCECIDTQRGPGGEAFCDDFGVQNSDVCEVHEGRPLVYCETNLG